MEEEIQKEVEARMRFKFNEIFTSLKNHSNAFKAQAWNPRLPGAAIAKAMEHSVAFDTIREIVEKEIAMPVPSETMSENEFKTKRNEAVDEIMRLFNPQDLMGVGYNQKVNSVVKIVEKLLTTNP